MNIEVINIAPEREQLLGFLRPTYTITDSPAVTRNFIVHRNIKSRAERDGLDVFYQNGIFISSQIFDELWDDDRIIQEVVKCSHKFFKNRKTKLTPSKDNFNQDCINFLFGIDTVEESDEDIHLLFEAFGSVKFIETWVNLTNSRPWQAVNAAMTTFLSKIKKDSVSVYYKKKAMLWEDVIKKNKMKALDAYVLRPSDSEGLSECKLFVDLATKS